MFTVDKCVPLVGAVIGVPIPVVAAFFFAGIGAMAGAIVRELSGERTAGAGWRVGKGVFWGRLMGPLGKTLLGAVILVIVVAAMLL
jgi:predicted membrane protein